MTSLSCHHRADEYRSLYWTPSVSEKEELFCKILGVLQTLLFSSAVFGSEILLLYIFIFVRKRQSLGAMKTDGQLASLTENLICCVSSAAFSLAAVLMPP